MREPMKYIHGPMGFFAPCDTYVRWSDYAALAAENANLKSLQWETLKERNKAEAENDRLRKAWEWMPIETAPKDGTNIQIRAIMRYDKDAQGWAYFQNPQTTAEWMPLSDAPKEGRDAK